MIILVNLRFTAYVFARFLTRTRQSLSAAEITCSKYLKEVTIYRGSPYALKALDVNTLYPPPLPGAVASTAPLSCIAQCADASFSKTAMDQHVTKRVPWVGMVALLQYHHGVLDMMVT